MSKAIYIEWLFNYFAIEFVRLAQSRVHLWKLLLDVGVVYFEAFACWWSMEVSTMH
jgi:hypothetical protein